MSSEFGKNIRVSVFGQSHSKAIGVVIDGIPAGSRIDMGKVREFMLRRAPGRNAYSTSRKEEDIPEVISGVLDAKEEGVFVTCGAPLCAVIKNTDQRSSDYDNIKLIPRPGHADFSAAFRYNFYNDVRGGGHFSGRLTAPLCFAGAIAKELLSMSDIYIGAHISSIGNVEDDRFDPMEIEESVLSAPSKKAFPVINDGQGEIMKSLIEEVRRAGDSIGGTVECQITGVPAGLGNPMFDGLENILAGALFGIPAVKGIEFGEGFNASRLRGSENNDQFLVTGDREIAQSSNHAGGILGGISNGMPINFRLAFKPTPSIAMPQKSVNLYTGEETELVIEGRHDPCIVPRAVPVVEAVAALCILDVVMGE